MLRNSQSNRQGPGESRMRKQNKNVKSIVNETRKKLNINMKMFSSVFDAEENFGEHLSSFQRELAKQ